MSTQVSSLYRHLLKGFQQESLDSAELISGGTLLGDRAFAFQYMDTDTSADPKNAPWTSKFSLAMQHDWPDLAKILPNWNSDNRELSLKIENSPLQISASVVSPEGRQALSDFVFSYMKTITPFSKARHPTASPLRLIGNADLSTRYTDGDKGPLSIGLCESLSDLENKFGFKIDERRFRLNIFLCGAPAWEELKWINKKLKIGPCLLQIYKPIGRCPNIDVDQSSGNRIDEIFPLMKSKVGHPLFGIKADILVGGTIQKGDTWELID